VPGALSLRITGLPPAMAATAISSCAGQICRALTTFLQLLTLEGRLLVLLH
jgi:hypothetical protein